MITTIRWCVALVLLSFVAAIGAAAEPAAKETHPFFAETRDLPDAPATLLDAYVKFAETATTGGELAPLILPQAVEITTETRPDASREYGKAISLPFLRNGFQPRVFSLRKDADDVWLVRTGSTAIWFVETKRGVWRVYRYLDKPIQ
ncbi:MAG: hypothetical protein QM811_23550 [Pirellulales bacterium]